MKGEYGTVKLERASFSFDSMQRLWLAARTPAANTEDLRQTLGEKLTDKLGEMIGTTGPMDPYDSREIDAVLDAIMPTIEPALAPAWQTGAPDVKKGRTKEFIVACRRKDRAKPFVFAANYANEYELDRDGDEHLATGWYITGLDMHGEYDEVFEKALSEGDEIVGWQPLPTWSDAA
jgi:hypothetical protein